MIRITLMMTVKEARYAVNTVCCLLACESLLSTRRRGPGWLFACHSCAVFTSESQTIQNSISIFSGCKFLFLVPALIQAPAWKFLRKLLCSLPSPSSLPTNRHEHFQRDANDICFILLSERPQSVGFKKKHSSQCQTSLWIIDGVCQF